MKKSGKFGQIVRVLKVLVCIAVLLTPLTFLVKFYPYKDAQYALADSGISYELTLDPGIYRVGIHIPQGTYDVETVSGDHGRIEIRDSANNIFLYANVGLLDETPVAEDMRLYEGACFVVSTGIVVKAASRNVNTIELGQMSNRLTDSVAVEESMIAGKDFPAGVYDISYVPMKENEQGNVEYSVPWKEKNYEFCVEFGNTGQSEVYRNVVFSEGTEISPGELKGITLIPSKSSRSYIDVTVFTASLKHWKGTNVLH